MIAVILGLVVSNAIFIYVFLSIKHKYKRKLLAATISTKDKGIEMQDTSMAIPGSNKYLSKSNPLLNADIDEHPAAQYDEISIKSENSLDDYDMDLSPANNSNRNQNDLEDKEVTLDMYTEDVFTPSMEGESPLEAALRLHERSRSQENLIDDGSEYESPVSFENYAYNKDTLESSEI